MLKYFKYFNEDDKFIQALDYAFDKEINKLVGFNDLVVIDINGKEITLEGQTNYEYSPETIIYLENIEKNKVYKVKILEWADNSIKISPLDDNADFILGETYRDLTLFGEKNNNTSFLYFFFSNLFSKYAIKNFLDNLGNQYSTPRFKFRDSIYRNIIKYYSFDDKNIYNTIDKVFDYYFYISRRHTKLTEPPFKKEISVLWSSMQRILDQNKYEEFIELWKIYSSYNFLASNDSNYLSIQRFKFLFNPQNDLDYLNTRFDNTNKVIIWGFMFNPNNISIPVTIPTLVINNDNEITEDKIQTTVYRNLFHLCKGFVIISIYESPNCYPPVESIQIYPTSNNKHHISWNYISNYVPTGFTIEQWYSTDNNPDVRDISKWTLYTSVNAPNNNVYSYDIDIPQISYTYLAYRVYPYGTLNTNKGILIKAGG